MAISSALHLVSIASLLALYWLVPMAPIYLLCVAITAGLFLAEHLLVRPSDLSRVNVAFFNVNSVISLMVLASTALGVYMV